MITKDDKPEPKTTRTTSQLWSRLEKIDEKIAALAAERAEIKATLEGALNKAN